MAVIDTRPAARALRTPVRNRYFFGKLMSVYDFQLETDYMNAKRHLLNRFVSGYGVVCGLDVQCGPDERSIVVTPGVAIDKWGREIVVPEPTQPILIPEHLLPERNGKGYGEGDQGQGQGDDKDDGQGYKPKDDDQGYKPKGEGQAYKPRRQGYSQGEDKEDEGVIRVMLCYHECESDPTPVMAGDCGTVEECAAGSIRERYRITFKEGPAKPVRLHCRIPDLFHGGRLDYEALAKHVAEGCPEPAADPCIPLANLRLGDDGHGCDPERIDITIRPIVYTNDLLLEIILSMLEEERDDHQHAK